MIYRILLTSIVLLGHTFSIKCQSTEVVLPFKHITGNEQVDVIHQLCSKLLWRKPHRSLEYAEAGLQLALKQNYQSGVANLHQDIGNAHLYMGDFDQALSHFHQAQFLYDSLNDNIHSILISGSIGEVFLELNDLTNAQLFIHQALAGNKFLNNPQGVATNHRRHGQLLLAKNQIDSAKISFKQSLKLMTDIQDTLGVGMALGHLANVYAVQNQYKKAENYFKQSLEVMRESGAKVGKIIILLQTANFFEKQKRFEEALIHYKMAIAISNEVEFRSKEMETHLNISNIYQHLGDHEMALNHFRAYVSLKDSVISIVKNEQIADMQVKYQTRSQQQKMEELKLQGRFQRLQIVSLAIIATLLVAGFWVWYIFKKKAEKKLKKQYQEIQRKNQIIKLKREEVEVANKELRKAQDIIHDKNEELLAANANLEAQVNTRTLELQEAVNNLVKTNEELDTFIYRSSHDIKGPISTLAGLCLLAEKEIKDDTAKSYLDHIQNTVHATMKQLENLMKVYEIKHTTIKYEEVALVPFIEKIAQCCVKNNKKTAAQISVKATKDIDCVIDTNILELVINNLLNNSLAYHHELTPPDITLTISKHHKKLTIDVEDNGIGILPEVRGKVFTMFFRGTEKSIGSGLGLYITKIALDRLDGDLALLSSSARGSHFKITLPIRPESNF